MYQFNFTSFGSRRGRTSAEIEFLMTRLLSCGGLTTNYLAFPCAAGVLQPTVCPQSACGCIHQPFLCGLGSPQRYGLFLRDFLTNPRPHFSTLTTYSLVDTAPVAGAGNIAYFTSLKLASHDDTSRAMARFFR